nr:hypothetical protein [uncultured Flavobacterium sp.]
MKVKRIAPCCPLCEVGMEQGKVYEATSTIICPKGISHYHLNGFEYAYMCERFEIVDDGFSDETLEKVKEEIEKEQLEKVL